MVSYLLIELFYIGMPVVRTDGRTYGHVITKISRMDGLPIFLGMGLRSRALRVAPFELELRFDWNKDRPPQPIQPV